MRWVFAVLPLVVACGGKKEAPPKETTGSAGSGSAAPVAMADAAVTIDAPTAPVELLHSYLSFVEVSSHVMNKTIKPEHLVDKDFNTAWNSKTGELVGAWLDVRVSGGAAIHEIKLTVGHTGKGPKGEDYFSMNPRITMLSVLDGPKVLASAPLDPNERGLQSVKLPTPHAGTVRLRIDAIVMGTKKTWKEVCISELEAWGIPPADAMPRAQRPIVSVYEPEPPPPLEVVPGKPVDIAALCESHVTPLQEAYEKRNSGRQSDYASEDAAPECGLLDGPAVQGAPWKGVAVWRLAQNSAHGPMTCNLVAQTENGDFMIGGERGCGPWDEEDLRVDTATGEDVIPGGPPELVVRYFTARHSDVTVAMLVCRMTGEAVQCTRPFEIEGATWKVQPRFSKGTVIFDPVSGKAPPEVSGPQALAFN